MHKTPATLTPKDKAFLDEFLATITVRPHNTPRLFAIGFIGLPGTGKSTLADIIGHDLGLPVNRSDQIRRFLNLKGFPGPSPRQDIMAALAEERTLFFYSNKTSVVIDANFTEYAENSQANALDHGASLLLVRTVCSDEVAIERLRTRSKSGDSGDSAVTEDQFEEIKNRVAGFPKVENSYYEVDTTLDLKSQLNGLYTKMQNDKYVTIEQITRGVI